MPRHSRAVDLSRFVRALGRDVRRQLDTSPGYPTHHHVTPAALRKLRKALKNPSPAARAAAIARMRSRILGGHPAP